MQATDAQAFRFEGYTLDLKRGSLHAGDREIELRPKSFQMLRYLVENAGRLISKEELIKAVWPSTTVGFQGDRVFHAASGQRRHRQLAAGGRQ